jgi:hypothetical protein
VADIGNAGRRVSLAVAGAASCVGACVDALIPRALSAGETDQIQARFAATGAVHSPLTVLALDLRAAGPAWSVAATQLDVAAIDAEFGHVHGLLPHQGPHD